MTGKLIDTKALAEAYVEARERAKKHPGNQIPIYNTGARSFIRVAGKPIGVCQDFRWQINAQASEIRTIDTNLPWDMVPNQILITASLSQIIDPSGSLESQGLFHTIQSMIHQPYVEMQVLDAAGYSIFFARGMFTGMNGQIARGQPSTWGANFQGVAYQHNVFQEFKPYPDDVLSKFIANKVLGPAMQALQAFSEFTGGFF